MVMQLRKERYDLAVLPGGAQVSALRFARLCGARRTIVRRDSDANQHEVEHCCTLLTDLGLNFETPRLVLSSPVSMPSQSTSGQPLIGLHISARKPLQRWPSESFVQFVRDCHKETGANFLLFWSPGKADNPLHPGDDKKALEILGRCADLPVVAVPSQTLPALIAGLARCTHVICSDGGAMHIAAGLGKPIICFFGNSSVNRWYPWGVPYEVLQKPTLNVSDVSVEEALLAFRRLCDRISHETPWSGTQHVESAAWESEYWNSK
jgi:ADP-heptose:LPS heptosyltransferase